MELWKPVEKFPHYEISNHGRIRSRKRSVPRILKLVIGRHGYYTVVLYKRNKAYCFLVHRLVLSAFVGLCPKGHQANHKNGIKTVNELENLGWITPSDNIGHAYLNGLINLNHKGTLNPKAKLCNEEVIEIRKLVKKGIKHRVVAEMFRISREHVSNIVCRRSWNHI